MSDINKNIIYIPADGNYIEILGYKIDGFESFEAFCEHLNNYAKLEDRCERLKNLIRKSCAINNVLEALNHDEITRNDFAYLMVGNTEFKYKEINYENNI